MFRSHQKGTFMLTFADGTQVSVVWKPGTYSDNHDAIFDKKLMFGKDDGYCDSQTAEVMVTDDPTGKMAVYLKHHHNDVNPIGYLELDEVMALLTFAWMGAELTERTGKDKHDK